MGQSGYLIFCSTIAYMVFFVGTPGFCTGESIVFVKDSSKWTVCVLSTVGTMVLFPNPSGCVLHSLVLREGSFHQFVP